MKILVINSGSSSLKYQLFSMKNEEVLASGLMERIGEASLGIVTHKVKDKKNIFERPLSDHAETIKIMMNLLTDKDTGVISEKSEIGSIGHRVVHGGEKFHSSTMINEEVIQAIEANVSLAPLHNPANLTGILACQKFFGDIPQVAVFDTAFHQSIPEHAYLYAIDYQLYKQNGVRRYGFHGTSHKFVAMSAAYYLQKPIEKINLITIHLGNGSSMAAIKQGKSIDTTMGLTPLEGIVMGTRSGDIDPGIIFFLSRQLGKSLEDIETLLNKKSGLKGLCGTNDMRDLLSQRKNGDERSEIAFQIYGYRIKKYIGAYLAILGHLDAIIFTGGIGENSPDIRQISCSNLQALGIDIDDSLNQKKSFLEREIQTKTSHTKVLVIPTNEELQIARETLNIFTQLQI